MASPWFDARKRRSASKSFSWRWPSAERPDGVRAASDRRRLSRQAPIDRIGHLLKAEAAPGERDAIFETAAIAMMKRADPTPPPPPEIADNELTFDLPVNFRSKTKM
jgi:hypothetical protein